MTVPDRHKVRVLSGLAGTFPVAQAVVKRKQHVTQTLDEQRISLDALAVGAILSGAAPVKIQGGCAIDTAGEGGLVTGFVDQVKIKAATDGAQPIQGERPEALDDFIGRQRLLQIVPGGDRHMGAQSTAFASG